MLFTSLEFRIFNSTHELELCVFVQASKVCNETGDRAACYHVARQFENLEQFEQAIHFFSRAQAYGNAIRLCRVGDSMLAKWIINSLVCLRVFIIGDSFEYQYIGNSHT